MTTEKDRPKVQKSKENDDLYLYRLYSGSKLNENGCLEWKKAKLHHGYGRMSFYGKAESCHRISWLLNFGEIKENLCVCHKCDNPSCIRPDHLFLGTRSDNSLDMSRKGRRYDGYGTRSFCKYGHAYNAQNTAYSTVGKCTYRRCKECHKVRTRQYRSKTK